LEDGPDGRQTATPSGSRRAVGPLRPSVAAADGWLTASLLAGGRLWDRRTRPDVRRTWPWTSERVTTLVKWGLLGGKFCQVKIFHPIIFGIW
jgi:hypothetical protein